MNHFIKGCNDPPLTQLLFSSACLICVSPPTQFAYHDGGLITTAASTKASVTTNGLWTFKTIITNALCPESSENIPILLQEADPYFSNQNDLRNPKMGSKQSVTGPTH